MKFHTKIFLHTLLSVFLIGGAHEGLASASLPAAVVSANKLATQTGIRILKKGGTAADAAIAMAFLLGVAEPQNSGPGGGGVLVYYEKSQNRFSCVDYLDLAPFLEGDETNTKDRTLKAESFKTGPHAVAVPGFVLGMQKIHERFGKLGWQDLLSDAISLAHSGFVVDAQLRTDIQKESKRFADLKEYGEFFVQPLSDKDPTLQLENLALTLEKISANGARDFYSGALAKTILNELKEQGSLISADDFSTYKVNFNNCDSTYIKDLHVITPPASFYGGDLIDVLLNATRVAKTKSSSSEFSRLLETEIKKYSSKSQSPQEKSKDTSKDTPISHTTHLAVIDARGNIATMTNSLGETFGSGIVLSGSGLVMNNSVKGWLDKESLDKGSIRRKIKPESPLTPIIVFRGFDPIFIGGASGGVSIPQNIFTLIEKFLIEGEPLAQAIKEPKLYVVPSEQTILIEKGFDKKLLSDKLEFKIKESESPIGNVEIITIENYKVKTFSDPRGTGSGEVLR